MTPPERILFPPEDICMDWLHTRRPGPGLRNRGSTCYVNVILQCLTYTPPLANYLLSRQHSQSCDQQVFCMMCIMEDHVRKIMYSLANAVLPRAVLKSLRFIGEFKPDVAGDAYEFFCCALHAMQDACLPGSTDLDVSSQTTTLIYQIFGGFLRSRVTCLRCQAVSDSYKAFLEVLLKIKAASSLTAILENFVKPKLLDGKQCMKCSKYRKKMIASKKITIHHAPRVLTLCLGRVDVRSSRKISELVEYPECLDLQPYMSEEAEEPLLYSLYSVVVHSGETCLAGHFFCYTKASDGLWYKMDDETMDDCDIHTVLGQQAYLLFYIRCPDLNMEEMAASSAAPPYAHSFLSQSGGSSKQVDSGGPQDLPGRIKVTHSQRNDARERNRSRSPRWGNVHYSWFMNSANYDSSTGRRKRTHLPDSVNAPRDDTAPGPSNRSCQWAPAHRAAQEQLLPRQREQGRSLQIRSYGLPRRPLEVREYPQVERRRRRQQEPFGTNRQRSHSHN
ncbi:ubiquitin carboxyl-terminal hydrolase 42-like [Chiroxiphia lanceolata]|uniref:ubiquitin carboxyl-terminal hydrolase 42-like n=1 Tax=Chiroxiphia lanceolata TaxID=296741 RepID=UPI0013CF31A9|nr:ubiquitin carboxyl-terminal hydrolase 42-like [Chiroxiphia lanceolata]XP_032565465.1 ubiquitin carboxyl-terminal hydrolase 42-like [Chiroxiphia lanceolata]XP_032565466.1 ubiquitin carboxyl-terminal hydrolase 42-like [Chiroxiphia lanceolata]XP_032565467.1 ubiquitin carboxyl-terminal hydrolase 42-like [Chiroxiphia lanceolata]XP_032565468.1 ubiquitin carboxyl-terminal hydrolase 42-like [Chiroxiphia lanceolata]